MLFPASLCRAGQQPVAKQAETTRVADGKTDRWAEKTVAIPAKSARAGVVAGEIISRRRPSSTTTTTRLFMSMLPSPKFSVAFAAAMAARVIPDQCPSDLLMRHEDPPKQPTCRKLPKRPHNHVYEQQPQFPLSAQAHRQPAHGSQTPLSVPQNPEPPGDSSRARK